MKTMMTILAACMLIAPAVAQKAGGPAAPEKLHTLRGAAIQGPEDPSENFRNERDSGPLPRDFVQQPPLTPHTTRGYTITKNFNKCLDCHAWGRTAETGATKISISHFKSYGGAELSNISPRRYFCTQCHVSQTDAKPLVGNSFNPAAGVR